MKRPKPLSTIRNVGIMAHIDAGKTTVSERILFYSGKTHKIGEVHEGEAVLDYMVQEREKGITITAAVTSFDWNGHEMHLIDTPGHVDFTVEVERSLRVLDGVVALFCAVGGVEPQSETVWMQAVRHKVPRIAFINKMDRTGADFERVLAEIRERFKVLAIPVQLPWGSEGKFQGVFDLINMRALRFDEADRGSTIQIVEIPSEATAAVQAGREQLLEAASDLNDDIAMLYLEGEPVPTSLIQSTLRQATVENRCVPVLCGSGLRDKGIQPLMDAVVDYLPSPVDLPPVVGTTPDGETPDERPNSLKAPFSALAFKVQFPEGRRMVLLRIYSGKVNAGDKVLIVGSKKVERVARLFTLHAGQRTRISEATAGMIVGAAGLKFASTGDSLTHLDAPILFERIDAREPVISAAVEPETLREKAKLAEALTKLADEDVTFQFEEDADTGELIMRGMGELHLEIIADRMVREFNVRVRVGRPEVLHRETITETASGHGHFFRETDDERIFGDVTLEVSPGPRDAGFRYDVDLGSAGASRGRKLLEHIEAGVQDALGGGVLRGDPVVDVHVKLTQLGFEEGEDLVPLGYRIAAGNALRGALRRAKPTLLQPLMRVEIFVPEDNLGDAIGDMSSRGGHIEDVTDVGQNKMVQARAPLSAMFGYSTQLRSMSQGRGTFSMEFLRYGSMDD